jgi:hypothetical protein
MIHLAGHEPESGSFYARVDASAWRGDGVTGSLLVHTLTELRYFVERALPEIRLASATTVIAAS